MREVAATDRAARDEAFEEFLASSPGYPAPRLDTLRAREFSRLDRAGHTYLDYTGSGLYAESLVRRHAERLLDGVFGNPHSMSPASRASTDAIESSRRRVLAFLSADPSEYAVVFTANASHALRLVGESFPFAPGGAFLLTFDNHNSVNGIREFARQRGADTQYIPVLPPDLRTDDAALLAALARRARLADAPAALFAYPAQSNFSGVQHPLEWIEQARAHGYAVLLDAAAFLPTNELDLSRWKPDFVTMSFYKMFGYPTGIGALVARRDALARLHRPWFAGGTIDVVSVQADRFSGADAPAGFEDGTPDFLAIPAVASGLDILDSIGMDTIHARVQALTAFLLERLMTLRHGSGRALVTIYGPTDVRARGGTIAFNLFSANGAAIDQHLVEARAAAARLSLRSGCFCNPGAGEAAFGLTRSEIESCLNTATPRMTYEGFRACIQPKAAGAIRVSLGLASTFDDAWNLVRFLEDFIER
jgi:selenocysteine lyase/cysteine desulfurase